jgi:hypothetical protein
MRFLATLVVIGAALPHAAPAQQGSSAGATDWFGRGIVGVRESGTEVHLDLRTESHGLLLRLVEGEPIIIVAVGPFAAGASVVRLAPMPPPVRAQAGAGRPASSNEGPWDSDVMRNGGGCLRSAGEERGGPPPPPGAPPGGGAPPAPAAICVSTVRSPATAGEPVREYLLLVLTDRPPDSLVTRRIRTIPGFDPATAAHDLAEYLVGRQSPMWAGYLVRR